MSDVVQQLRARSRFAVNHSPITSYVCDEAADEIEHLTARVAELEACLADVLRQLELGGAE